MDFLLTSTYVYGLVTSTAMYLKKCALSWLVVKVLLDLILFLLKSLFINVDLKENEE